MSRTRFALESVGILCTGLFILPLGIIVSLKLLGPDLPIFRFRVMLMGLAALFTTVPSILVGSLVTGIDEWFGYGDLLRCGNKVVKNILLPRLATLLAFTLILAGSLCALLGAYAPRLESVQAFFGSAASGIVFGLFAAALTSFSRDPWGGVAGTLLVLGFSLNTRAPVYALREVLNPVYLTRRYAHQVDAWALAVHLSFLLLICALLLWLIIRNVTRPQN